MSGRADGGVKRALSWGAAFRIAWRELRSSPAKFLFVILSVAIGVAALTGVRGFANSFETTLLAQARTIMAADLSARMFRLPTAKETQALDALGRQGVERTVVTETVSMVSTASDPIPLIVSLKVVDPAKYPFYGAFQLLPQEPLGTLLTPSTAVVGEDLLIRLHTHVGDALKIGNAEFRIAGVVEREPDRMNSTMGLGPRVFITRAGLDRSGLIQPGSRAGERFLFKLDPQRANVASVRSEVERILPEAQVMDYREANPSLTQGLHRASNILSLICLVAMVLGAIGVAMAMRAHLQQRMDILAIMKSIGARSSDILRIYLLQTLFLGIAGGVLGALAGFGVEMTLPLLVAKLLPLRATLQIPVSAGLAGLGTGVLTTLLFCLPPLLDIRRVKPNLVLRRMVEEPADVSWRARWQNRKAQWVASAVIVLGLAGIAAALTSSFVVARWFTASLCALLVSILLLAAMLLAFLRRFLARTRLHLPSPLRHGLANLYRPGNQTSAVLTALGAGVMLILAVFLMQSAVLRDMQATLAAGVPNVFLVDISKDELAGVKALVAHQPGIRGKVETLPVVAGRIDSVNGVSAERLQLQHYPRHLLRSAALTWSAGVPAGTKVRRGHWWASAAATGEVAVSEHVAERLRVGVGSEMVFVVNDRAIPARVAAVFENDGQHIYARSEYILPPPALAGMPVVWYGAAHVENGEIPNLQRVLFAAYPTVTTINIADVLDTIQGVVRQITLIIRFLAGFSILAGVVILASSVASTRFRRIREVVVMKALGAKRPRISAVFGIEFTVMGLLAGLVGVVFANLLAAVLLHQMEITFHVQWGASVVAMLATAVLAIGTGWLASFRILGQKPLEVLREE
jgi:putative ABC transport system permease protein